MSCTMRGRKEHKTENMLRHLPLQWSTDMVNSYYVEILWEEIRNDKVIAIKRILKCWQNLFWNFFRSLNIFLSSEFELGLINVYKSASSKPIFHMMYCIVKMLHFNQSFWHPIYLKICFVWRIIFCLSFLFT